MEPIVDVAVSQDEDCAVQVLKVTFQERADAAASQVQDRAVEVEKVTFSGVRATAHSGIVQDQRCAHATVSTVSCLFLWRPSLYVNSRLLA